MWGRDGIAWTGSDMADVPMAASGRPHIRPTYGLHMGVDGQLGCLGCVWGGRLGGFFLSGQAARAFETGLGLP